jgi:hypothetical protein
MYKSFKKSQAAMEFLMTYGWAILVVLVAIGALAYFGVLSPDRFLPSKCQLPAGIACTDFRVSAGATPTTGTITIVLRNGLGFDIGDSSNPITVSVSGCDNAATPVSISNGNTGTYALANCDVTSQQKFSGNVNVTYYNVDTLLSHKVQGTLTGRAE